MLDEEYPAFEESLRQEPYQALRINTLKADPADFLKKELFLLRPVPWADNGFYYAPGDVPGKHPYHAAGVYYIQEPSAMAPAEYLQAKPGEKVLDLCGAPGGKSTQHSPGPQSPALSAVCNTSVILPTCTFCCPSLLPLSFLELWLSSESLFYSQPFYSLALMVLALDLREACP